MATFQYHAMKQGKRVQGKIEAQDRATVIRQLKEQGFLVILEVKEKKQSVLQKEVHLGGNRIKTQDFVVFCRQFATLIQASVPILDALNVLMQQTENKLLKKLLGSAIQEVTTGKQLSDALAAHKKVLPPLFISLIRAGEASGTLDDVLERLAVYFDRQNNTIQKVKGALTYPIFLFFMTIIVCIFLMTNVIPVFVSTFRSMNIPLPLPTRIVIGTSNLITTYWYVLVIAFMILAILLLYFYWTEQGRYVYDFMKLKVPIFGKLLQKSAIARAMRTLTTLYASAVPTLQALQITGDVVGNVIISKVFVNARESVRNGASLTQPLRESWVFPPLVIHMIAIGEQTGSIDQMFAKIADFYESEVDNMVDRLKPLIEPIMIVFLTGIVGVIVLSVLMPMFSVYQNMHA